MTFQTLAEIYVGLLGLLFGSFLNVVIHRLPRGISTVLPRSRCPRCLAPIRPWQNLPVISFLVLGGRCGHCRGRISGRYPLVETLTAVCFVVCWRRLEPGLDLLVGIVFCCAMVVLAFIDFEHFILPDAITKPGIVLGLALQPWLSWVSWRDALLGTLLGAGLLAAVAWLWMAWRGVEGMGWGDVKLLAMVGAFLGWRGVVITLLLASLAGSVVGIAMILSGRMGLRSKLSFGTYLAGAAVVSLFFGDGLWQSYLGLAP